MKVGIGADHSGFEMKQQLAKLQRRKVTRSSILVIRHLTRTITIPILRFPWLGRSRAEVWCAAS